jgi:hypothetical protein
MRRVTLSHRLTRDAVEISIGGDYIKVGALRTEGHLHRHIGVPVTLTNSTLRFEWGPDVDVTPHPDVLCLTGVLAFFPVLVNADSPAEPWTLHLDWSVSDNVQVALRRHRALAQVEVESVEGAVPRYTASTGPVLSFGGGYDSLAASEMYPTARLVHESPLTVLEGLITDSVHNVSPRGRRETSVVYTNQRYIYDIWGVGSWPAVLSSAALFSPSEIVTGLYSLDTLYLDNGVDFFPFEEPDWIGVFAQLGMPIRTSAYLSEYVTTEILHRADLIDRAAYCERIPFRDCGTCPKCFRRRLVTALVDTGRIESLASFDSNDMVLSWLRLRPLRWAHLFEHAIRKLGWLPGWVVREMPRDLVVSPRDLSFQERYYAGAFDDLGFSSGDQARLEGVLQHWSIAEMTPHDVGLLKSFRGHS